MPSNANLCSRSCSWNHKRQTALRTVCACLSVDYGCFQCKKKLNRKSLVGILVWSLVWQKAKGIQRKRKNRHNECKAQKIRDGSNEFRMWIREIPFRIFERWFWRWLALVRWRSEWRKKNAENRTQSLWHWWRIVARKYAEKIFFLLFSKSAPLQQPYAAAMSERKRNRNRKELKDWIVRWALIIVPFGDSVAIRKPCGVYKRLPDATVCIRSFLMWILARQPSLGSAIKIVCEHAIDPSRLARRTQCNNDGGRRRWLLDRIEYKIEWRDWTIGTALNVPDCGKKESTTEDWNY